MNQEVKIEDKLQTPTEIHVEDRRRTEKELAKFWEVCYMTELSVGRTRARQYIA